MELNQEKIEDAIVAGVVERLVDDDSLMERVTKGLTNRLDNFWAKAVEEKLDEEVNKAILSGFEREYQKVNAFGQKIGEPTTLSAEMQRLVGNYWSERVDTSGKKTDSSYSSTSRAEWLMNKIVADGFTDTMKQHVGNVGGVLKDELRKELHNTVNRLLSDVFHVRSPDEQKR